MSEIGEKIDVDIDNVINLNDLENKISTWFKSHDPNEKDFDKVVKQMQLIQRFFLKLKNTKNNV